MGQPHTCWPVQPNRRSQFVSAKETIYILVRRYKLKMPAHVREEELALLFSGDEYLETVEIVTAEDRLRDRRQNPCLAPSKSNEVGGKAVLMSTPPVTGIWEPGRSAYRIERVRKASL